jgi:hypothetical protein
MKQSGRVWTELIGLRIREVMSSSEHGNELLGSIKCREFCDFRLLPWHK